MSNVGDDWISKVIDAARSVASVSDDAATELKQQLAETMRERALSQGELNDLARALLTSMVKSAPAEDADE
jgi:hypothetical protein